MASKEEHHHKKHKKKHHLKHKHSKKHIDDNNETTISQGKKEHDHKVSPHKPKKKHTKHSKKKHHTDENPVDTSNTSRQNETKTSKDIIETKDDTTVKKKPTSTNSNDKEKTIAKDENANDDNVNKNDDEINEEISIGAISEQPSLAIGKEPHDNSKEISQEISAISIGTELEIEKARENATKPKSRKAILKAKIKRVEVIGHEGKYKGDLASGIRHGQGKIKWTGGNSYVGSFKNGLRDGK